MGKYTNQLVKLAREGKVPNSSILKASVFKEELEKVAKTKTSLPGNVGSLLAASAAIGLGTLAAGKLYDTYQDAKFEKELPQHFDAMLDAHPQLLEEDPVLVKRYFQSLVNVAPNIAQDPLAAGAFITQSLRMSELGGPSIATYKDLAQTQKDVSQARKDRTPTSSFGTDVLNPVSAQMQTFAGKKYLPG